ncbi:LINE-1 reverse transcriptase-like [Holothuria leucospilota]|uniref:LINE-1 reverse transcriptase-like n=1 Tax=Holothuria leucospilota TaxID=206669 RepID=A0A9Q1BAI1_HOLLE|nr:LINE-1 reverse transcriptase-like [Holothuria leucospilota]
MRNDHILAGVVYRPPSCNAEDDQVLTDTLMDAAQNKRIMIVGDFNFPDIDWIHMTAEKTSSQRFLQQTQDSLWFQHIIDPTRGDNILDLLLTSESEMVEDIQVGEQFGDSDHNCITWNCIITRGLGQRSKFELYDWKKANWEIMINDYKDSDWNELFRNKTVEEMWQIWLNMYKEHVKKHVPQISPKRKLKPKWMTNEVKRLIRRKRKAWKSYRVNRTIPCWNYYKALQKKVKEKVILAKKRFETLIADNVKEDPKSFYSYIRSKQSVKSKVGPLKDDKGNVITSDSEIAERLNDFFKQVFTKEKMSELPQLPKVLNGNVTLSNFEITEEMVQELLCTLQPGKAAGPDGVKSDYLRTLSEVVAIPLAKIYQKSLAHSYIPKDWKLANIVPLHKKGSHAEVTNYRPINLTSIPGKIMETLIRDVMVTHLEENKLILETQHGFRRGMSCVSNMLLYWDNLTALIDQGIPVDVVYLDLQKAFDTVPHCRLLHKIQAHGIDGLVLHWIQEWLKDRRQRVVLNGSRSEYCTLMEWTEKWQMKFNVNKCAVLHFGFNNPNNHYFMDGKKLCPNINPAVNPNINPAVNPNINPAVNPNINPAVNPNINPAVNPLEHLGVPVCQPVFISPICVTKILEYITALKSNKAPGSDEIPVKLVKSASHVIAPVLAHIFNVVFSTGSCPEALKIAKVIPLFKKDVNDMNIDIANTDDGRMTKPSAALDEQFECFNQKGLHFIHLNVRSLIPKLSELKLLAVRTKATIIALSETWLDDSVTNAEISIEGYSVLRRDRNRNGGGVCLYVSNKVAFNFRLDLNCDQTEAVWVDLLLPKSKPITVCSCYRPPDDYNFISALEVTISHIRADCELIILGDLNIDFLRKTGPLYDKLNCLLSTFACKQVIDSPTRVTDSCSSLLDHIICNNDNKLSQSGTISIGLSDHFLIYCTRKRAHKKQVSHHHNTIKVRSLKHYSKQSLVTAITTTDWSEVYCSDVDKAWCVFKRIFTGLIDNIAPIKEIRLKKRTEPWMTSEILDSIRLRDQLLHRFKRDRNQDLYSTYTKIRNKVQRDVKHAKSKYFLDKIAEDKANPRKLWQHLKSLGYSSTPDEAQIVLNIDGEVCSAPKGVANYINDFFTKISSSLVKDLPQPTGKFDFDSSAFKNYYNKMNVVSNSFKLCKVSTDFVYNEICALKISKGTGLDGIPARFIKDGADVLKDQLTHIINLSIETSTVPLDFKYARVKPLFKKQSRLDVSNYRPISILSVASKVLEKAIFTQMEKYLKENNMVFSPALEVASPPKLVSFI